MAQHDYTSLVNEVKKYIRDNGQQAITGPVLQAVLLDMISNYPPWIGSLGDISGVDITNPKNGDSLVFNGNSWINKTLELVTELAKLSDVQLSNPKSGDVLKYNGSKWVNGEMAGATYTKLTKAAYNSAYSAGTLDENMLYIIID